MWGGGGEGEGGAPQTIPGAPLTYFTDGGEGGEEIFLGLKFWPKGIFCIYDAGIFWVAKKTGSILGIVLFIS